MEHVEASPSELLEFSLKIGALELFPYGRGLKSGRISPYFFNSGLFNTGKAIDILALCYAAKIAEMDVKPDYIFGPAYKGIPLCATIALQYYRLTGVDVKYIFDRKEKKEHGDKGIFVGFPEGKEDFLGGNVVLVDDVMTTGKSLSDAKNDVQNHNGIPVKCIIGMDRQERGIDSDLSAVQLFEKNTGISVTSVMNFKMLMNSIEDLHVDKWWRMLPKFSAYEEKYGVS